jgi:hypothetical protein
MTVYLKAIVSGPGDSIQRAAEEAIGLAKRLGIGISFLFNEIELKARSHSVAEDIVNEYHDLDRDRIEKTKKTEKGE